MALCSYTLYCRIKELVCQYTSLMTISRVLWVDCFQLFFPLKLSDLAYVRFDDFSDRIKMELANSGFSRKWLLKPMCILVYYDIICEVNNNSQVQSWQAIARVFGAFDKCQVTDNPQTGWPVVFSLVVKVCSPCLKFYNATAIVIHTNVSDGYEPVSSVAAFWRVITTLLQPRWPGGVMVRVLITIR